MQAYEKYCKSQLHNKIPNWRGKTYKERVGDCIYDFSFHPAKILKSVHNEGNRKTDLGGIYTLLSDHFYYFGDKPEPLPTNLLTIVNQTQGHRSTSNQPYVEEFVEWIMNQRKAKNKVYSEPKDRELFSLDSDYYNKCSTYHKKENEMDEQLEQDQINC